MSRSRRIAPNHSLREGKGSGRGMKKRGNALLCSIMFMMLLASAAASYIYNATETYRQSYRAQLEIQCTPVCEAGIQTILRNLWRPFKINQNFTLMDTQGTGASTGNPMSSITGTVAGVGNYAAGIISYTSPANNTYTRVVVVRCVSYIDFNGNGQLDAGEPSKTVDVTATFTLSRSEVFDYTYFVNNYGWMDGFGVNDLVVNGDMRANGDFRFTNGSPTVNGSVYATANQKLIPSVLGLINTPPVKQSNLTYNPTSLLNGRMRQGYSSTTMGSVGSTTYNNWNGFMFDTNGSIQNNQPAGSVLGDSTGIRSWVQTSLSTTMTSQTLDATPTQEVVMPDLSNLATYTSASNGYVDTKATFQDGTANPNFGKGAYVQTWNQSLNSGLGAYQTISTAGVVTGSASLLGSALHPVIIHGPITITQDAVIKGNISGQGTIYTGRNVQIVGSITYTTPPDFRGVNQTTIDNTNEHADMLGLAARGSVIMGDTSTFTSTYPLQYMTPPFTHARYDDNGNLISAYNATSVDSTGNMLYQSVLGGSYIHSVAAPISQIDAVIYTNFVGGGDIGTGGTGMNINGSIISRDEAMVTFSLPMVMNYDGRIRERTVTQTPLIDLQLPRSPAMLQSTWQDRGFVY